MSPFQKIRANPRTVPGSDLEDRTLGVGDPRSQDRAAGKARARYSHIDLSAGSGVVPGGTMEFDVPHDLKRTPTLVELKDYENAVSACTITARGVRQENWSHSHAHVEVTLIAGSLAGCMAHFLVSGK
jgi:hypothetical protein